MTEAKADSESRRRKIRKTTITPAPGDDVADGGSRPKISPGGLFAGGRDRLATPLAPWAGPSIVRTLMTTMLSLMCLMTVGGAILLLLLWQQERDTGVLASQLDRTWDLFEVLRTIERWVAFATVPVAVVWMVLATVNVRRATGHRPSLVMAALSLPAGLAGVWYVGRELVAPAEDWPMSAGMFALQSVFVLLPLVVLLRTAVAAEARHRPMRVAAAFGIVVVGLIQFLGALSTVDQNAGPDEWGRLGAYLIILALTQVLGTLAVNEGARAIEEGTEHRFQLRSRFGESLLAQAGEI